MRRRIWSETLPLAEHGEPAVLRCLAAAGVEVLLAVRPWQLAEVAAIVEQLRGEGLVVGLWPMLADADGRWASVHSIAAFIAFTDAVLAAAPACDELVIDLEPPLEVLARWKALRPAGSWSRGYRAARAALSAAVVRWRSTRPSAVGRRVTTAVLPLLALEARGEWLQRALGTPATALAVDAHNVMAYSSLYEGWSHGLVGRRGAERLVALTARLARLRFGARAAISLGCIGRGAFGDEPGYRAIGELERDVAIARASGIEEIALFDLGGAVRRGDLAGWLGALRG